MNKMNITGTYCREYLIAQITEDRIKAEEFWSDLSDNHKNILNKFALGLDNYKGRHIEAPIGSTWKAHRQLELLVYKLTDKYMSGLANTFKEG